MSDVGRIEFGPGEQLGRARNDIGLAIMLMGAAIGLIVLAWSRVSEERRRPNGYRGYADALESRCEELNGALDAWKERANVYAGERTTAREAAHEAQVREQVAISAAIGGPVDPWAPMGIGSNGTPAAPEERQP